MSTCSGDSCHLFITTLNGWLLKGFSGPTQASLTASGSPTEVTEEYRTSVFSGGSECSAWWVPGVESGVRRHLFEGGSFKGYNTSWPRVGTAQCYQTRSEIQRPSVLALTP
ncbi:hypothetical protein E2C01_032638 [Portunus trituberculatus]|uniref:Uncharacterized protein n=1 Tax=Portunus trituberculatus TaxID=210409 RepID=A0A5B7F0Y1_PORTR|nr:hypothetical protein [Portunus trituberculatus]